ncbi:phage holin family protein [Ureibacillus sp. FSL K6-8385]|uniref:Holin n=1 Tax=Ureibacillus terrenus TaxID=118246 RepID=A0A540V3B8_9BACL|nr:phage holin family protein [Ureibacillus terrenus]MED3662882.1 phage holin family protein [Ureibacillus terrenus]MED3765019.1 phage holin family protein [Ureibacillus terrenus]TQE91245.1 holin [Ureibacillus terrenus]
MDFIILEDYIYPESVVIIPVLYLLGLFLNRTPKVPPWVTPWVQVVLGIAFCIGYYGFIIEAFVQGVLVAGAAAIMKDLFHKANYFTKKERNGKDG